MTTVEKDINKKLQDFVSSDVKESIVRFPFYYYYYYYYYFYYYYTRFFYFYY